MKTLIALFVLISLNGLIIAQSLDEAQLTKTIDSLQNIINVNNEKIETLKAFNTKTESEIIRHSTELNMILNEGKNGDVFLYCEFQAVIYDKPDFLKRLGEINVDDKVKVIDSIKSFYKVYFNGIEGYSLKLNFISAAEINKRLEDENRKREEEKLLKEKRMEQDNQLKEKLIIAMEQRKKDLIEKYGQTNGTKIFMRKIWLGMTKEMLFESWGQPDDINRSVGSWGVHEQMVYGKSFVYIENDVLTSWQD
jgi:hypothetical protein